MSSAPGGRLGGAQAPEVWEGYNEQQEGQLVQQQEGDLVQQEGDVVQQQEGDLTQ